LVSQFDELNLLAHEKRLSVGENKERDAIRSRKEHSDFYVIFVQKLRYMVTACETRASGMVACGDGQSLRSVAVQMVQERSLGALKKSNIGVLVAETNKLCKQQVPLPFMDAVGSVIQTLAMFKGEREKFPGVARVADFATIAAMAEDSDGLHRTIECTARHLIRSRRFVGTKEEFGEHSQRLLKLMNEQGCTRSKGEACLVADEALATLMKPVDDCPVRRIVKGLDSNTRLDEALSAVILGSTVLEIRELEPFKAGHARAPGTPSSVDEVICTDDNGFRLQQRFEPATLETSAQVQALKNRVAELSASHATREEAQALRALQLTRKINNLESASGENGGSGSCLVQMHADFREKYKDKMDCLDGESMERGHHIDSLLKRVASLEEQIQQQDEVLRTHSLPSPKETRKKDRFWNASQKKKQKGP
jgi:hypothetical protein